MSESAIPLTRRTVLLSALAAPLPAADGPTTLKHVMVYREPGRFGGWPANHGIWSWGNEILVGFSAAYFKRRESQMHQADPDKPEEPAFARSLDGGETWTITKAPEQMLPRWGGKEGGPFDQPIDFTGPGFAMTMRFNTVDTGPTVCWYTQDKGVHWLGPYEFPSLGLRGIAGRPNYLIQGKHKALVFLTAAKKNGKEGRPLCARTNDGGLTWRFVSYLCDEPRGFAIMPSAVNLASGRILAAVRVREPGEPQRDWIDAYSSSDEGRTWAKLSKIADTGRGGNPASLVLLRDGRVCATYGFRNEPYAMMARISSDGGSSWGSEIALREGGKAPDLGYPRSIVRPDGMVVTVYYFNDAVQSERFIEAAIWNPGKQ